MTPSRSKSDADGTKIIFRFVGKQILASDTKPGPNCDLALIAHFPQAVGEIDLNINMLKRQAHLQLSDLINSIMFSTIGVPP